MFIAGLKFALGLVLGISLFSFILTFLLIAVDCATNWRKKRRRNLDAAKARAQYPCALQIRESAIFCYRFRTDDWMRMRDQTGYLQ